MRTLRRGLIAVVLGVSLTLTSCLGPNNAFDSVTEWNQEVTDNKWLNELVFLGLNIIPVYGVALLGDYVIFNSIEFWGGENPIDAPDGA